MKKGFFWTAAIAVVLLASASGPVSAQIYPTQGQPLSLTGQYAYPYDGGGIYPSQYGGYGTGGYPYGGIYPTYGYGTGGQGVGRWTMLDSTLGAAGAAIAAKGSSNAGPWTAVGAATGAFLGYSQDRRVAARPKENCYWQRDASGNISWVCQGHQGPNRVESPVGAQAPAAQQAVAPQALAADCHWLDPASNRWQAVEPGWAAAQPESADLVCRRWDERSRQWVNIPSTQAGGQPPQPPPPPAPPNKKRY